MEDDPDDHSVAVVLEAYRRHALEYYGDERESRYRKMLPILRYVRELYADIPAKDFSPKKLKRLRQSFVDAGFSRGHCNVCTQRMVGILRWAASEEDPRYETADFASLVPFLLHQKPPPIGKSLLPLDDFRCSHERKWLCRGSCEERKVLENLERGPRSLRPLDCRYNQYNR